MKRVICIRKHRQLAKNTYNANKRSSDAPAEFKPTSWVIADHIFNSIKETVGTEAPGNGDALKKDEPKEDEVTARIAVEQLEHVHSTLHVLKQNSVVLSCIYCFYNIQ